MRKEYNKLVRDRIPEIIQGSGAICDMAILSEPEYRRALLAKLIEEAQEVQEAAEAAPDHLSIEVADVFEVLDALMAAYVIDPEEVARTQEQRRAERGGFEKRIYLLWVER